MSGFRQPEVPREQMVLWSQRLEDAVPLDHPVRLFDELLGSAVFAKTFAEWEQQYDLHEGQPPYHPRDLAGLYLYGMLNQHRSSRKLESACYNRLDVIWLLSGQTPDHSTIAAFVSDQGKMLKKLFRDVLAVGLRAGLVKLEQVAVDGSKIEADAGRGSVRSEEKIRRWLGHVDEKVAALEEEWSRNERQEATWFGEGGDGLDGDLHGGERGNIVKPLAGGVGGVVGSRPGGRSPGWSRGGGERLESPVEPNRGGRPSSCLPAFAGLHSRQTAPGISTASHGRGSVNELAIALDSVEES